jgi:hypothetical protein
MKPLGSPTRACTSSSGRWLTRAIPAQAVTRSACTTSTAGSSNTTRPSVVPRYKRSLVSMASFTRVLVRDPFRRTSCRPRSGCCGTRMISTRPRVHPRLRSTFLESSRSTIPLAARPARNDRPGVHLSGTTVIDLRPPRTRVRNRRSGTSRERVRFRGVGDGRLRLVSPRPGWRRSPGRCRDLL